MTSPHAATATVAATGSGLTAYLDGGTATTEYTSFNDASVIDTVKGTVLGDCGAGWEAVTGVYTPVSGQDHDGQCVDACAATACSVPYAISGATAAVGRRGFRASEAGWASTAKASWPKSVLHFLR